MAENFFETQYDVSKKSKVKKFYEENKILIFSTAFILIILLVSFSLYFENKEKKKILLSENYLQAKIYLERGDNSEAVGILKKVIFENDPTYSTLCFFMIMDQNLITDYKELSTLFDHILKNNKFPKEVRNLLIYKKALLSSSFVNEAEFLESTRLLINTETIWKPHALILLGDYFFSKGEKIKAIEFYQEIFSIKNLDKNVYDHAKFQLEIISNE